MVEPRQVETSDGVAIHVPEEERPPVRRLGPRDWARENLFNTWYNTALTLVFGALLAVASFRAIRFVFVSARWEIIRVNLTSLLVGLFPRPELWRVWVALYLGGAVFAAAIGMAVRTVAEPEGGEAPRPAKAPWTERLRRAWPVLLLLAVLLSLSGALVPVLLVASLLGVVLGGFLAGRRAPMALTRWAWAGGLAAVGGMLLVVVGFGGVPWDDWGGLMLTLFLAVGSIVLSFPLGLAAALGRRSRLPALRIVSIGYIELLRGVPLITVLFMSALTIRFFLPRGMDVPGLVVRAMIGLMLFTGAYVGEIVRGGLQGVPKGQIEAAQAVGLSPLKVTRLVVLPQALRSVIPALVGQFISLFKDTSLVVIIGLTDLLFFAQAITSQPQFLAQGLQAETLAFAAFVYWVFAYTMSKESQRIERRLGLGER
ncbi:MAG: amino acid ABC transporter permease [Nitriliruptorales bacterium]